jgi:hypothetical protein
MERNSKQPINTPPEAQPALCDTVLERSFRAFAGCLEHDNQLHSSCDSTAAISAISAQTRAVRGFRIAYLSTHEQLQQRRWKETQRYLRIDRKSHSGSSSARPQLSDPLLVAAPSASEPPAKKAKTVKVRCRHILRVWRKAYWSFVSDRSQGSQA